MQSNKWYLLFYLLGALIPLYLLTAYSSGAPQGYTGSPGDHYQTCRACHTAGHVYHPTIRISGIPDTGYGAGETYTLQLEISHAGNPRSGFEICIEDTTHQKVGRLSTVDQFTHSLDNGHYITHSSQGNTRHIWNFRWTAPAEAAGNLTLYYAINLANGDGNSTGDDIHTGSIMIPAQQTAVPTLTQAQFRLYPIPANNALYFESHIGSIRHLQIFDTWGRIFNLPVGHQMVDISSLPAGTYRLYVETDRGQGQIPFIKK